MLQHTFFTPKVLIEEVIKNLNLLLTQIQIVDSMHTYVMYATTLHIHGATQEWHNFLDALASLDFKLSMSQWLTFFGFSDNQWQSMIINYNQW